MKPRPTINDPQDDLFKVRLSDLVNPNHALCRLAHQIDWAQLEKHIAPHFSDLGAAALPVRLMAGLLYLEHAFKVSDERVVEQWLESPYWQYFCGETFFRHEFPCDPSSLTRWRQRLGEEGCEWLLTATIDAGLKSKLVKPSSLKRVVIDTTVQEKNIRFPTDSQLQNQSRKQLVTLAHELGISLRQTYQKQARFLLPKIGRYAHAKQFKRMRKALKKIKNALGCVHRDLLRKITPDMHLNQAQVQVLFHAERLLNQQKHSKHKLYSLHAPETECLSKGKAHKRYEFGVKASFATTLRECFVVGARSFAGNPYDGHTLSEQLEQVKILCNDKPIDEAYVDKGYRGSGYEGETTIIIAGQKRGITQLQQRRLNRRNSIEPIIGHMKQDGKLGRCYLKGQTGDAINVILCGAGQNIRKLLKWLCFAWYLLSTRQLHWLFSSGVAPKPVIDARQSVNLAA